MLNKVVLQGRLGMDLELRTTPNGACVTTFRLAVGRNYKGADGQYSVDWINCVAWRTTAEFMCKNFVKGNQVIIEGELTTRDYDDKNGNKVYITEVNVTNAYFCEKKTVGAPPVPSEPPRAAHSTAAPAPAPSPDSAPLPADDDYPF